MADSESKPTETSEKSTTKPKVLPKRRRWFRRFFLLSILLLIAGWFAPLIVAKTDLRNQLPKLLLPQLFSQVQLGETRLDWLSPIDIRDIRIEHDSAPLLDASRFSSSEPLWKVVARFSGLGTFRVQDPIVHVSLSDTDSNVERFLSKWSEQFPSGDSRPSYQLEIENGRVELDHAASGHQSSIEQVVLHLKTTTGVVDEVNLASGNLPSAGADPTSDWIVIRYLKPTTPTQTTTEVGADQKTVFLKSSKWKLDRLSPLLCRLSPKAELEGELNADTSIAVATVDSGLEWDWGGSVGIEKLVLAGFAAMDRDRLTLDQVQLTGRTAATQGRLAMHDVKIQTDVGELTATGDVPLGQVSTKSPSELVQSLLSDEDYHVQGRLDLTRLARLLPQTLHLRDGIEITGGDVNLQLAGAVSEGVRRWSGTVGVTGLSASNRGQPIPWNSPLNARFAAHRDQNAIVVDSLKCQSDFLTVTASGTLEDAKFVADGNLTTLLNQLERFVDLGITQMAGVVKVAGELKRLDASQVALTSQVTLNNFSFGKNQQAIWREQHLELTCSAKAQVDSTPKIQSIDSAEVRMTSGGDSLKLVLEAPINWSEPDRTYAVNSNLIGNLATWQTRLSPFVSTNGWRLAGKTNLSTVLKVDPRQVVFSELSANVAALEAFAPGWMIQDPNVKLATAGSWDRTSRTWKSQKLTLESQSVSADIADLEFAVSDQGLSRLIGRTTYKADLVRLSRWRNLAIPNPSYYLLGTVAGTANVKQEGAGVSSQIEAEIQNFIVAGPSRGANGQMEWTPLWKEPQVKLSVNNAYDTNADQLVMENARVQLTGLVLTANGKLDQFSTSKRIDLNGDVDYDWEQLSTRFGPAMAQNVQLTGKDRRPFSLKGTLVASVDPGRERQASATSVSFQTGAAEPVANIPPSTNSGSADLSGQGSVGWQSANFYGFTAGAGDLSAKIDGGVCQFVPLNLVVNDGKLHLSPTIYLDRSPAMFVLPQEKVVDQVTLSPELCRNALKLALPMLADSAEVDGKFSLDVQAASLPLSMPSMGSAEGVISIHRAQAKPGAAALQLVSAINQIQSLITRRQGGDLNRDDNTLQMPEQQIPVKLQQGRVYHQGMTFVVRNVTVKTSGSVGVDNTLNLIAEIPIRDEWIGNNKPLMGLKGKSLQVPIGGTTSNPQIDPNFIANLAQQIGGSALDGVLQDKIGGGLDNVINNGLDKLLRNKK